MEPSSTSSHEIQALNLILDTILFTVTNQKVSKPPPRLGVANLSASRVRLPSLAIHEMQCKFPYNKKLLQNRVWRLGKPMIYLICTGPSKWPRVKIIPRLHRVIPPTCMVMEEINCMALKISILSSSLGCTRNPLIFSTRLVIDYLVRISTTKRTITKLLNFRLNMRSQ